MGGGNSGDGHWHAWLWLRSELEGGGERSVSPRGGVTEWERGWGEEEPSEEATSDSGDRTARLEIRETVGSWDSDGSISRS